jgi:hypothetical protein
MAQQVPMHLHTQHIVHASVQQVYCLSNLPKMYLQQQQYKTAPTTTGSRQGWVGAAAASWAQQQQGPQDRGLVGRGGTGL